MVCCNSAAQLSQNTHAASSTNICVCRITSTNSCIHADTFTLLTQISTQPLLLYTNLSTMHALRASLTNWPALRSPHSPPLTDQLASLTKWSSLVHSSLPPSHWSACFTHKLIISSTLLSLPLTDQLASLPNWSALVLSSHSPHPTDQLASPTNWSALVLSTPHFSPCTLTLILWHKTALVPCSWRLKSLTYTLSQRLVLHSKAKTWLAP
jgi:hypothetical protein